MKWLKQTEEIEFLLRFACCVDVYYKTRLFSIISKHLRETKLRIYFS